MKKAVNDKWIQGSQATFYPQSIRPFKQERNTGALRRHSQDLMHVARVAVQQFCDCTAKRSRLVSRAAIPSENREKE